MNGIIKHIVRVEIDGKVFESVKPDEIVIDRFIAHGKKVDCQFRYAGTGRGDMAVNLKETESCEWGYDDDGYFETGCKQAFCLEAGTIEENEFKFCVYCGKPIKEVKREEQPA